MGRMRDSDAGAWRTGTVAFENPLKIRPDGERNIDYYNIVEALDQVEPKVRILPSLEPHASPDCSSSWAPALSTIISCSLAMTISGSLARTATGVAHSHVG